MTIERRTITDRATWLEWRKADVTASDLGALSGVSPYKTRLELWMEKTGLKQSGGETNLMRRGRWLEGATLIALREEMPDWRIEKANVYLRDTELRLGATPDLVAEEPDSTELINIQLKAIGRPTFEREWADDTTPLHYQLQTLAEGMLIGASTNYVAVLVIDTYSADLVLREVPRRTDAEAVIREKVLAFWSDIAEGRRPPVDYRRDEETIKALYPHADPELELDLSTDNRLCDLLPARATYKAEITGLEGEIAAIDNEIKAKLGAAERASLPGWKLSWKEESRVGYEVKPWTGRVLRVRPVKEDAA